MSEVLNRLVSLCPSATSIDTKAITVGIALERIRKGHSREKIKLIRNLPNGEEQSNIKKRLPGIIWSGEFGHRADAAPSKSSGLACLDFDHPRDGDKELIAGNEYTFALWASPRGKGLKVLVRIPEVMDKDDYKSRYSALLEEFSEFDPDEKNSNYSRLCFESHDPQLYINQNAALFTKKTILGVHCPEESLGKINSLPEGRTVQKLLMWWQRKFDYGKGNRNNALYILSCSLCEYGIAKETTLRLLSPFAASDFTYDEINKIIDSAYRKTSYGSKSFSR